MMAPKSASAAVALFVTGTAALSQEYCSNENTGSGYTAATNIYNSNLACQEQCEASYAFAIVQWQSCWCSNTAPANQQSVSSCNEQCPGYPSDNCGNQSKGLFGYIALSISPSGTAGVVASSSTTATIEAPSASEPSSTSTSSPSSSHSASTSSASSSTSTYTTFIVSTPSAAAVVVPVTAIASSSTSTGSPITSVETVTRSGAVVTQTVTSTPINASGESQSADAQPIVEREGLSGGAIAGIVIGVLLGLAAIVLGAFLFRRRRQQSANIEGAAAAPGKTRPRRNISVLSKTGLLSQAGAQNMAERDDEAHTGSNSVRHSIIFGGGAANEGVSPSSPLGSTREASGSRRNSKPLVYDQRLNPSALFANAEANGSRVSMQDQQDYSRPLGIANPDLRASFDSRLSHG